MKPRIRFVVLSLTFTLIALGITTQSAKATFIQDPNPGGINLFLNDGKGLTSGAGHVGDQTTGPLVTISTPTTNTFDMASGNATITPNTGLLTDLIFTPADSSLFSDFNFRGQLLDTGNIIVLVTDNQDNPDNPFTFGVNIGDASQEFQSIGVISNDGETIKSVEIISAGFMSVKQINFSYAAVPEPASLLLLGFGLLGLAGVARRRTK